ncbi:MAG: hypothetical protein WCI18_04995 [Pseudomonadota bacterium]
MRPIIRYFVSICVLFKMGTSLGIQEPYSLRLDLPILDMPSNTQNSITFPSMNQSLAISRSYYDVVHLGLAQFDNINPRAEGWNGFFSRLTYAAVDIFSFYIPGGNGWLHEEWHRAVMSKHGISSYNDIYRLNFFSPVVAVSHVTDEELAKLKEQNPEDQVRLAAAGMEAEHSLAQDLERDLFFRGNTSYRTTLLWFLQISPAQYLATCASTKADESTEEGNQADGASIKKRDFIGLDCNGWIRDLSRPKEPYADRGAHPSGVGVDRYTTYSELSPTEKKYLRLSRNFSLLNFVDPFLFNKTEFRGAGIWVENGASYNFKLRHDLASFGNSLSGQFFYKNSALKTHSSLFAFHNRNHWFPGLEVELVEMPIGSDWDLGIRGQIWKQPKDFLFDTSSGTLGGLAGVKIAYKGFDRVNPYFNVIGKTRGWVSGIVDQERNLESIIGLVATY